MKIEIEKIITIISLVFIISCSIQKYFHSYILEEEGAVVFKYGDDLFMEWFKTTTKKRTKSDIIIYQEMYKSNDTVKARESFTESTYCEGEYVNNIRTGAWKGYYKSVKVFEAYYPKSSTPTEVILWDFKTRKKTKLKFSIDL